MARGSYVPLVAGADFCWTDGRQWNRCFDHPERFGFAVGDEPIRVPALESIARFSCIALVIDQKMEAGIVVSVQIQLNRYMVRIVDLVITNTNFVDRFVGVVG